MTRRTTVRLFSLGQAATDPFLSRLRSTIESIRVEQVDCSALAPPAHLPAEEMAGSPVSIFLVDTPSLTSETFRSLLISAAWYATMREDRLCLLVRRNTTRSELRSQCQHDEVLTYAINQLGLELSTDDPKGPEDLAGLLEGFLGSLRSWIWRLRLRRARWFASAALAVTGTLLNHAGVGAIALSVLLLAWMRWRGVTLSPRLFEALALPVAFVAGMVLAGVPARPAFDDLRRDEALWNRKLSRYFFAFSVYVSVLVLLFAAGRIRAFPLLALPVGFVFEILSGSLRFHVFLPLVLSRGLTPSYAAIEMSTGPQPPDRAVSFLMGSAPGLGGRSETAAWNDWARRGGGQCCRTVLRPRTRVFISYTWKSDDDVEFAKRLATGLRVLHVQAFLDRQNIPHGSPWRSIISREIAEASHFIFVASTTSVRASSHRESGGTCLQEVRQALAMMKFSACPTIAILMRSDEDALLESSGSDAFRYLIAHAYRLSEGDVFNSQRLDSWLRQTAPNGWVQDLKDLTSFPGA